MNLSDINNLDLSSAGSWPAPVRAAAVLILCAGVLGAGYWFDTKDQVATLQKAEEQEQQKKQVFEAKQRKAANLGPLKEQLEEMKQSFGAMLRQLPNEAEIEALLVDISQTGLASGLEFELFAPGAEVRADFYGQKPMKIKVTGTYHQFGEFVSGVASLPRIVTQHNVSVRPKGKDSDKLVMETIAKTYRYIDEDENVQSRKKRKGKKRKKK